MPKEWVVWLQPLLGTYADLLTIWQAVRPLLPFPSAKPRPERFSEELRVEIDTPDGTRIRAVKKTRFNRD